MTSLPSGTEGTSFTLGMKMCMSGNVIKYQQSGQMSSCQCMEKRSDITGVTSSFEWLRATPFKSAVMFVMQSDIPFIPNWLPLINGWHLLATIYQNPLLSKQRKQLSLLYELPLETLLIEPWSRSYPAGAVPLAVCAPHISIHKYSNATRRYSALQNTLFLSLHTPV